jgi:hypothetical protein
LWKRILVLPEKYGYLAGCGIEARGLLRGCHATRDSSPKGERTVTKALRSPWTISVVVFAVLMVAAVILH